MLALFFFLFHSCLFFTFFFPLCDVTFSADVLKANPSNLGAQITRVSFSIVSLAVYLFCVYVFSSLPLPILKDLKHIS